MSSLRVSLRAWPAKWMSVEGSDGYPSLQSMTEELGKRVDLAVTYKPSEIRFAASDHLYFGRKGVPIISYFDGGHDDYHQPTDTVDKINFPKIEKVAKLCYLTMWQIANTSARPVRVEPKKEEPKKAEPAKTGAAR